MIRRIDDFKPTVRSSARAVPGCPSRLTLVAVAILLLVGCSFIQITYNNLAWVLPWYVADYISLNDKQEVLLGELIEKELGWHRRTQLPRYARWLRELIGDTESGFTDGKAMNHFAQLEEFRRALMRETAANLAVLLATVSDDQINEMFRHFDRYNREFRETYIDKTPEELEQNRLTRMEDFFADWLGPLTKKQRTAITHWSRQRGSIAPEVYDYRRQWQARFRIVLNYRKERERFNADLQQLFVEPHLYSPPSYLGKRERNILLGKELFIAIMDAATKAQKQRLQETLQDYASDFEKLSLQS